MNIIILGGAGFIGTNLALKLSETQENNVTVTDESTDYFDEALKYGRSNIKLKKCHFGTETDFKELLSGQDEVFHLVSTTIPANSNTQIPGELTANVVASSYLFEACVAAGIKKVVFISSGGTVYGKESGCPLKEDTPTYPISSYGLQKITIEKLLYLYHHIYGIDYRVLRIANPYGPYQRPNGRLGVVTTFIYRCINGKNIDLYGDGRVVRDYIYIDDVINAIVKVTNGNSVHRTFNIGSGTGTSLIDLIHTIEKVLGRKININHLPARDVDVMTNYLDVSRYKSEYGQLAEVSLEDGIIKTADFLRKKYP